MNFIYLARSNDVFSKVVQSNPVKLKYFEFKQKTTDSATISYKFNVLQQSSNSYIFDPNKDIQYHDAGLLTDNLCFVNALKEFLFNTFKTCPPFVIAVHWGGCDDEASGEEKCEGLRKIFTEPIILTHYSGKYDTEIQQINTSDKMIDHIKERINFSEKVKKTDLIYRTKDMLLKTFWYLCHCKESIDETTKNKIEADIQTLIDNIGNSEKLKNIKTELVSFFEQNSHSQNSSSKTSEQEITEKLKDLREIMDEFIKQERTNIGKKTGDED
jgi:flagellar hook-basal body complex protein FliE